MSGDIIGDGIVCDCCFHVVSISQFEARSRSQIPDPFSEIHLLKKYMCEERMFSLAMHGRSME